MSAVPCNSAKGGPHVASCQRTGATVLDAGLSVTALAMWRLEPQHGLQCQYNATALACCCGVTDTVCWRKGRCASDTAVTMT